jgi:RNA polymerase sigma factor (sigma-70 family)
VRLTGDSALPWLLGVATNVLRNRRRSQWRHRAALARIPREHARDFADEANRRIDDERQMRTALRAIATLPQREQDVFALCAWAELSYEDAAAALGVPVGTVRSRLSRARARIRELSSAHGHERDCEPAVPAQRA